MIESPFAALRLRTDAATRFKKAANATAVVWRTMRCVRESVAGPVEAALDGSGKGACGTYPQLIGCRHRR